MEEFILRARNGDKDAFTELVLLIKDDLYKIARTRLSNEEDIADCVQETMIETFKFIKKLKDVSKFKKWIIKILINKCNKVYKRKYKNDVSIDEIDFNLVKSNNIKEIESELNFYDIIKILNYEERIIMLLYYMEDYSVKNIKNILKMNENTINTHLYRARKKIKQKYNMEEFYE